jgi:hypothetical protein
MSVFIEQRDNPPPVEPKKSKAAASKSGTVAKGKDEEDDGKGEDADTKKMMEALASTVVMERPNVRWYVHEVAVACASTTQGLFLCDIMLLVLRFTLECFACLACDTQGRCCWFGNGQITHQRSRVATHQISSNVCWQAQTLEGHFAVWTTRYVCGLCVCECLCEC